MDVPHRHFEIENVNAAHLTHAIYCTPFAHFTQFYPHGKKARPEQPPASAATTFVRPSAARSCGAGLLDAEPEEDAADANAEADPDTDLLADTFADETVPFATPATAYSVIELSNSVICALSGIEPRLEEAQRVGDLPTQSPQLTGPWSATPTAPVKLKETLDPAVDVCLDGNILAGGEDEGPIECELLRGLAGFHRIPELKIIL
ncbi:hypothetical protein DFH09DRAFT_1094612 [Mycena vulgaris]|nr:hypothetical protein DFH09DRAFT_1094612 [Mycena vulgaris]